MNFYTANPCGTHRTTYAVQPEMLNGLTRFSNTANRIVETVSNAFAAVIEKEIAANQEVRFSPNTVISFIAFSGFREDEINFRSSYFEFEVATSYTHIVINSDDFEKYDHLTSHRLFDANWSSSRLGPIRLSKQAVEVMLSPASPGRNVLNQTLADILLGMFRRSCTHVLKSLTTTSANSSRVVKAAPVVFSFRLIPMTVRLASYWYKETKSPCAFGGVGVANNSDPIRFCNSRLTDTDVEFTELANIFAFDPILYQAQFMTPSELATLVGLFQPEATSTVIKTRQDWLNLFDEE